MPGQNSNFWFDSVYFGVQIQPNSLIRAIIASVALDTLKDLTESSGCTSGSQTKETGKVLKKNFTKVSAERKVMHSKMFEVQTEDL